MLPTEDGFLALRGTGEMRREVHYVHDRDKETGVKRRDWILAVLGTGKALCA